MSCFWCIQVCPPRSLTSAGSIVNKVREPLNGFWGLKHGSNGCTFRIFLLLIGQLMQSHNNVPDWRVPDWQMIPAVEGVGGGGRWGSWGWGVVGCWWGCGVGKHLITWKTPLPCRVTAKRQVAARMNKLDLTWGNHAFKENMFRDFRAASMVYFVGHNGFSYLQIDLPRV